MATVQIRHVPEDVHRTYQARAAAAGMSLQEYLRAELINGARTRSPSEVVAEVEQRMGMQGPVGFAHGSSADLIRADRQGH